MPIIRTLYGRISDQSRIFPTMTLGRKARRWGCTAADFPSHLWGEGRGREGQVLLWREQEFHGISWNFPKMSSVISQNFPSDPVISRMSDEIWLNSHETRWNLMKSDDIWPLSEPKSVKKQLNLNHLVFLQKNSSRMLPTSPAIYELLHDVILDPKIKRKTGLDGREISFWKAIRCSDTQSYFY